MFDDAIVINWRRSGGFETENPGQPGRAFQAMVFGIAAPVSGRVPGITDWEQMQIRCIAQRIDDLKRSGLLAFETIRVN
jgi:hypothetical protein